MRSTALRIIFVGIVITVAAAFSLLFFDVKDNADVRSMGWPFIVAGPPVVAFGIALWPREKKKP